MPILPCILIQSKDTNSSQKYLKLVPYMTYRQQMIYMENYNQKKNSNNFNDRVSSLLPNSLDSGSYFGATSTYTNGSTKR